MEKELSARDTELMARFQREALRRGVCYAMMSSGVPASCHTPIEEGADTDSSALPLAYFGFSEGAI
jgi:hypothetical protein